MKEGYEKISRNIEDLIPVFRYNNLYYDKAGIIKVAETWTQSRPTKYRKLADWQNWEQLEQYQISAFFAAPVGEHHLLLTNGAVLFKSTLREVGVNMKNKSSVSFVDCGQTISAYRASLVIHYFIDDSISIYTNAYYLDGDVNNPDISNVNKGEPDKKRAKKFVPKSPTKPVSKAEELARKMAKDKTDAENAAKMASREQQKEVEPVIPAPVVKRTENTQRRVREVIDISKL